MLSLFVVASAGMMCQPQAGLPADLQAAREGEVARLIAAATPLLAKSDHHAKYPVQALGILRAEEAIPLLVKHISYLPPPPPGRKLVPSDESPGFRLNSLPCAYALGKIGHPCFDEVVRKLCETDDNYHVMCVAITLRVAFGPDDAITLLRTRGAACNNARAKSRINKVITDIDKIYRHSDFE